MSLFSAIGKGIARSINDKHAENQRKKAKEVAYKKTGKTLRKASKHGEYVNGSATYKKKLAEEYARIDANHKRTEYMINDV